MKATHFMALALALAFVGMPPFVLSADLSTLQDSALTTSTPAQSTDSFRALSKVTGMDAASPAPLADQELAQVEGGFHVLVGAAAFGGAFLSALEGDFTTAANYAVGGAIVGNLITHP